MAGFLSRLFGGQQGPAPADFQKAAVLKDMGNESLARGELEVAAAHYCAAVEICPSYAEAYNNLGFVRAKQGDLDGAERCYAQALRLKPELAPAHFNQAVLLQTRGKVDEASESFRRALRLAPKNLETYVRFGELLHAARRYDEAVALLDKAIEKGLDEAVIHLNLGILYRELVRPIEAESSLRRAIALEPGYSVAHYELGRLMMLEGSDDAAEASFRAALRSRPDYPEAHTNLGLLLERNKRLTAAEEAYRDALRNDPDFPSALNNLGVLLMRARRFDEAEDYLRKAVAASPDKLDSYGNLGFLFHNTGRYEEAEAIYREIVAEDPDNQKAHGNLGFLYADLRRFEEAEAACRRAMAIDPNYVPARKDLGYILLSLGRFSEGWPLQEGRYDPRIEDKSNLVVPPTLPFPQWQGEPLAGKSLLVCHEQGFGDEIQFCRYVTLLKSHGVARIGLVCSSPLCELFASIEGIDEIFPAKETTRFRIHDYWVMSLSLPLYCKTTLETIPAHLPYLTAPLQRISRWLDRLPAKGLRVGLVWRGSKRHNNDVRRSLPGLAALAPLWSVDGVSFVSLQKGAGEDEGQQPPFGQPLVHLGSDIQDFADSAAIVSQLDLVICVDTAMAHLAGALGRPCWVLLPWIGTDWRWLHDRDDSPWYPGVMRLFRQRADGDWETVIAEVAQALRAFACAPH